MRPTRAEIDLSAIVHNLRTLEKLTGRAKILAVVKADAYGHGLVSIAKKLDHEGVYGFGVALAEEGLELRESGVRSPILVLNGVYGKAHRDVLALGLTPVIHNLADARAFSRVRSEQLISVHLKVDTGMARLGVPHAELSAFLSELRTIGNIQIEGLLTHFASADEDTPQTQEQLQRFKKAQATLLEFGYRPTVVHAANSAATLAHSESHYDVVRVGLGLYGLNPDRSDSAGLIPALRLRSEVIAIRDLPAGSSVGYGASFHTQRPSRIATIPVGYGDGILRAGSGRASVLVKGVCCPIVGRVSMDLITFDVTDVPGADVGDEVILLGSQGSQTLTAHDWAEASNTIAYEVLTNLSLRIPRIYK